MTSTKTAKPSSILTRQILEYLVKSGHYATRINNIPGTKYRAGNVTKGVADILGVTKKGVALAIEIKTTDRQSDFQKEFESHYKQRGGIYIVAKKLEDVIDAGL